MINVVLCKEIKGACEEAQKLGNVCAVEVEYGDEELSPENCDAVILALNHHGPRANNTPPSEAPLIPEAKKFLDEENYFDNFIVSHIDADTILGIMWMSGIMKNTEIAMEISKIVSEVDIKGFHYYEENLHNNLPDYIKYRYLAIGQLISKTKFEDNSKNTVDVSRIVHKLILKVKDIIVEGPSQEKINSINNWLETKHEVAKQALVTNIPGVMNVYKSDIFLNNAYCLEPGNCVDIIVQYNTGNFSIVISAKDEEIAQRYFGENGVIEPLKKFFGDKAGGRKGIGGSPRDHKYKPEILESFVSFLNREYINLPQLKI